MEKVKRYFVDNKWGVILTIAYFFVALVGRYVLRGAFDLIDSPDALGYKDLAHNLITLHFFSADGITGSYTRTPGYPLILAGIYVVGGGDIAVIVLQYLMGSLILFMIYRIAHIVCTKRIITGIVLAIAFINVEAFVYHGLVLSEAAFVFTVVLGLFFWVKYLFEAKKILYIFGFSLSMAAAVLIRPIIRPFLLVLAFIFIILTIAKVISFKSLVLYTLIVSVTVGGWCYRNMQITGTFEYDYRVKFDLYRVLARNTENYRLGYADPDPTFTNGIEHVQPYLEKYVPVDEMDELVEKQDYRFAHYCELAAKDYLSKHVFDTIKVCIRSSLIMFLGPVNAFWKGLFDSKLASVFANGYTAILALTYLIYIIAVLVNRKKLSLIDLSVFGYILYMVVVSSTNVGSRYRLGFIYIIYIAIICAFKNKKELSSVTDKGDKE